VVAFPASINLGPSSLDEPLWRSSSALAQTAEIPAKDAFEATRELGTVEAWEAFLASYPTGFYSDLARAYIGKLKGAASEPPASATRPASTKSDAGPRAGLSSDLAPTVPGKPAVLRGTSYMGFPERFNRYYTDPAWKPARIIHVSANGTGDGATRSSPTSPQAAVASARPGTLIHFLRGAYQGGLEFKQSSSGTYDEPIVLLAERSPDNSIGVSMACGVGARLSCLNFENASYIAVDGFELIGGRYGVRAVGGGYAASQHSRGITVLNSNGHDQTHDPFFTGASDWAVFEGNLGYGAQKGDGHGIYISNGSDWNIVRFNETHSNVSSDFQINADPASTCKDVGIPFDDPRCDAYAGTGEGGQGASDYFLVDSNYFHHGGNNGSGPNFTSVRRSVVRNNIIGFYPRHGTSFWQETDNPKLGTSDNKIVHNLFITTGRHAVQFVNNSTRNDFSNNVMLGVRLNAGSVQANPSAVLLEVDESAGANVFRANLYVAGKVQGRSANAQEMVLADFAPAWFARFPIGPNRDPNDFKPTAAAPFLGLAPVSPDAPTDRHGVARAGKADLGPIEVP